MSTEIFGAVVLLVVGSVFFAVGFFTLLGHWKLVSKGELIDGEVVAIEFFRSRGSTSEDRQTKSSYYSSIVQFSVDGVNFKIATAGTNKIRHELKQTAQVHVLRNGQGELVKASVKDSLNVIVPSIFLIVGIVLGAIAHVQMNVPLTLLGAIAVFIVVVGSIIFAKINDQIKFKPHEPRMDSRMIESAEDMKLEVSRNSKIAYFLGSLPLIGSIFLFYGAYNKMNHADQTAFSQDSWSFISNLIDQGPSASQKDPLMVAGIGLFFFLAGLYSLCYTRFQSR